jgi:hypothetical protein
MYQHTYCACFGNLLQKRGIFSYWYCTNIFISVKRSKKLVLANNDEFLLDGDCMDLGGKGLVDGLVLGQAHQDYTWAQASTSHTGSRPCL